MADIKLTDLRDMWKSVSDWVKGTDIDSKPKVEVTNFPETQNVKDVDALASLNEIKQQQIEINTKLDSIISGSPINVQMYVPEPDDLSTNNKTDTAIELNWE